jgi:ribonuclease BN (tRNA processing enzyme)
LHGVRTLIAEATLLEPGGQPTEQRGSLTADEAGELATHCAAETLLLAHMWEERGFEAAHQQAASEYAGDVVLAQPGLALEW